MKQYWLAGMLLLSGNLLAQMPFSAEMQQTNPQSVRLLKVPNKTLKTANGEDMEMLLGQHQTYIYPDSIRATGQHTHEVMVEMRQKNQLLLRQLWQMDCNQPKQRFAQQTGLANFVQQQLSDTPLSPTFARFRHATDDASLDLDYQYAAIYGKQPFIEAACKYIKQK